MSIERPNCINHGCNEGAMVKKGTLTNPVGWRVHCSHCQSASWGKHPHREGVTPYKTGKCVNQDGRLGYKCPIDYDKAPHAIGITEVDHIDGNHCNNDHSNLQELCPICHKIKGKREGNHRGHKYGWNKKPTELITLDSLFNYGLSPLETTVK